MRIALGQGVQGQSLVLVSGTDDKVTAQIEDRNGAVYVKVILPVSELRRAVAALSID
jgi:hypothetical protein